MSLEYVSEILELAVKVQENPIFVNSGVKGHMIYLNGHEEQDEYVEIRNLTELINFIKKIPEDIEDLTGHVKFSRSYFFEGVELEEDNKYCLVWGS